MKHASDIQITLEYKIVNKDGWDLVRLTANEYFELEPGEDVELNSIPRHGHGVQYLQLDPRTIHMTKLTLTDDAQKADRVICETFWNNGQNRAIERNDRGSRPYWELILEITISESPLMWEILRLGRKDGILTPWYHGVIRQNADGSQTETKMNIA